MFMTRKLTFIHILFLALLAVLASAGVMSAEDWYGQFTVEKQVNWGSATLPPGNYTFKLNTVASPYTVKIEGKPEGAVYVFAVGMTTSPLGSQSSLLVLRRGGKGIVRSLYIAKDGKTFTYFMPKGELPIMASEPLLIQRIPVVASGK